MVGTKFVEFLADASHNDLQGFLALVDGRFPYRIIDLVGGEDFSWMSGKEIQDVKFIGREVYTAGVIAYAAGGGADGKGTVGERFRRFRSPAGADTGLYAEFQLL